LPWCGRGKDDGNIWENHGKVLENHGKYHFLMEFFQKQWGNISENIGKSWEIWWKADGKPGQWRFNF
jgi:hypothetical protein